jgi:hypothetical protein
VFAFALLLAIMRDQKGDLGGVLAQVVRVPDVGFETQVWKMVATRLRVFLPCFWQSCGIKRGILVGFWSRWFVSRMWVLKPRSGKWLPLVCACLCLAFGNHGESKGNFGECVGRIMGILV